RRVSITRNTIVVPFRRACMFRPCTERGPYLSAGSGLDQVFRLEFIERMTARNSPYSIRRPARTPVVKLLALVPAAAAGYVSSARRLESPIVPQCLANIDFAQRVSVDHSGLSVPPIAIRDPRNLLIRAVGCGDETIFRDLKFTLAANTGIGGH